MKVFHRGPATTSDHSRIFNNARAHHPFSPSATRIRSHQSADVEVEVRLRDHGPKKQQHPRSENTKSEESGEPSSGIVLFSDEYIVAGERKQALDRNVERIRWNWKRKPNATPKFLSSQLSGKRAE
ncbi:hypothetical protein HPP92_010349 [Vanilla planifolia]|uniref:Uncharacterized protein n=1 Tax=Vanilla planifolia TaxID=51239 RepID=A0A835R6A5_VANPL|nr:hypothetical protein HPP92_010561 [Vanilla planifolia]KAG0482265.1 hypothetical protein HPP92_010349 [Vanilla planifolia]